MLGLATLFLIIALVAAALGLFGIAGAFLMIAFVAAALGFFSTAGAVAGIATIVFVVFLTLSVTSLFFGRRAPV
jgi:uncharacterized membrane protein YtjA (UPF0391 family)